MTAAIAVVPLSVPADGLVWMANDTIAVDDVTTAPFTSRNETWMAGAMAVPTTAFVGGMSNWRWWAAGGATVNALLVAAARPVPVAVSV